MSKKYKRCSEIMNLFFQNRGEIVNDSVLMSFDTFRNTRIVLSEKVIVAWSPWSNWKGFTVSLIHKFTGNISVEQFFNFCDYLPASSKVLFYDKFSNIMWNEKEPTHDEMNVMIDAIDKWLAKWH